MIQRLLIGGATLLILAMPSFALAHNGEDHASGRESHESTPAISDRAEARLDEAKKKVCEKRTAAIEAIMARNVKRAENLGQFFATTTERVKHFVQNQTEIVSIPELVPGLIDSVEDVKTKFQADLSVLQEKAVFSCDSDNPKEQITAFQEANRTVMQDLKDWRKALKDLIAPFKPVANEDAE